MKFTTLTLFLFLSQSTLVWGSWSQPYIPPDEPEFPEYVAPEAPLSSKDSGIDRSRSWVVKNLDTLSTGIDNAFVGMFFNDDALDYDSPGSRGRISLESRFEEGEQVAYKFGVNVNLELPNTNRRLNLLLQSEDDDIGNQDPIDSVNNTNYSSALRFIIRESLQWRTTADTGIRWGVPPDPFARLRARRNIYFDTWNARVSQELNYYSSEGYGAQSDVRFDYPVGFYRLVRVGLNAEYLLNNDYVDLKYGMGLYEKLSPKTAVALIFGANANTEDALNMISYDTGVRLRRKVYREWMFLNLYPQMVWREEDNWAMTPVFTIQLQAEFNH
ncbi:MAG: hypothetical protein P1U57_14805 [Oleibacter sp.]|nr:hypothetical protein [Thalassolituus sp.]